MTYRCRTTGIASVLGVCVVALLASISVLQRPTPIGEVVAFHATNLPKERGVLGGHALKACHDASAALGIGCRQQELTWLQLLSFHKPGSVSAGSAFANLSRVGDAAVPTRKGLLGSIACTDIKGLPTGPDGLPLFNLAFSPTQIKLGEVFEVGESFAVLDSNVSARPSSVVPNFVSHYDGSNTNISGDSRRFGFSFEEVVTQEIGSKPAGAEKKLTSLEVYGAVGRWSNFRPTFGLRGSMMLSVSYLAYISVATFIVEQPLRMNRTEWPTAVREARWHPLGRVPFPSNTTMRRLATFQEENFPRVVGKKSLGRGGLEDCLYFQTHGGTRHYVAANIGFNFGAGQFFVGEITSRVINTQRKGAHTNTHNGSVMSEGIDETSSTGFDYEVVPMIEDPEGFGIRRGDKPANSPRAFEKNWNVIPCDSKAMANSNPHLGTSLDDVVCFLTNLAPEVRVYAFDMVSRKVVAKWLHSNPRGVSTLYRGGKGFVPIAGDRGTSTDQGAPRALLTLAHEKMRGGYRMEWLLISSSAPHNLINPCCRFTSPVDQKQRPPIPASGDKAVGLDVNVSSGALRTKQGHFKLTKTPIEYVRSITPNFDMSAIYFSHSINDAKGRFCSLPVRHAVSAALYGLD